APASASALPSPPPPRIRGQVLTRGTRAPIVGARIIATARAVPTPPPSPVGAVPAPAPSSVGTIPAPAPSPAGAVPADSPPAASFETESDAEGRFELRGLPDGPIRVTVTASGFISHPYDENLGRGQQLSVRYYLERPWTARYEATVRGQTAREEVSRR